MKISFPGDVDEINDTDFDILRILEENGALWKMEITRKINARRKNDTLLDVKDSISKQAVSKRVERLFELGYVDTSIISFKKIDGPNNGSLIRGYDLSSKGEEVLDTTVQKILRDVVSESIIREEPGFDRVEDYIEIYNQLNGRSAENLVEFVSDQVED